MTRLPGRTQAGKVPFKVVESQIDPWIMPTALRALAKALTAVLKSAS